MQSLNSNAEAESGFVGVSGTQFTLNGQPFRVGGVNIHYLSWATQTEVDNALSDAEAMHANVVRTIIGAVRGSSDGKVPTIWKSNDSSDSSNLNVHGTYDLYWDATANHMAFNDGADGLQKMDYVIAKAQSHNLKLLISMMDFWPYTGGAQQMRAWYGSQDQYTFFFTDPRTKQDYKDWVAHLLNRVNTITHVAYKDDPTIFGWDLMNEPTTKPLTLVQNWSAEMSAYVKTIDSKHVLSAGAANFPNQLTDLNTPTIDFGTWHAYPTNFNMSPSQLTKLIQNSCASSKQANKPVLLEEFGYASSHSDQAQVYQSWTDSIQNDPDCAGWLLWRMTAKQDNGQYPPDNFDKYDIHNDGSPSSQVISKALASIVSQAGPAVAIVPTTIPTPPIVNTPQPGSLVVPQGTPGKSYYAAFPMTMKLDGDLTAWRNVPQVTVKTGPQTSPNPAENGSVTFAAVADNQNLYLLAEVPDTNIVANQHGIQYWLEDSIEVYINATGDLNLKSYTPGVAQITFPAASIGQPADAPILTGVQYETLGVKALVFKTSNGYAVEAAISLNSDVWHIKPAQGTVIGFEVDLNGASQKDRDTKLIWSAKNVADTAHDDPSVFGQLIFQQIGS